ncbi:lysine-specific permease [Colletotrichum incanum]|uniref:Lysine-specific permease n=1 Tax=Colletotrichum incanum TaxID=1573173 RepID=A0A161Y4M7_COLIC|nr:lysine-specific permease [Colletotrichum incanum]
MRSTRYSTSRQKACQQCATSKIKCDRKAGSQASLQSGPETTGVRDKSNFEVTCGPASPGIIAENINVQSREPQQVAFHRLGFSETLLFPPTSERIERAAAECLWASDTCRFSSHQQRASTIDSSIPAGSGFYQADELDFSRLELICPINADDIANRWLNSFVPLPGQKTKDYTPRISAFIHRILRSYANSSIRGHRVPPFVHWSQLNLKSSVTLPACISILRTCDKSVAGGLKASAETLQKEITKLFDQHKTADDMALLAIFQAHLIYSLAIFFQLGREHYPFLSQTMINTQELACAAARKGLVCMAEQDGARPTWESWIVAEAKRRTLFTMCLFDSALLTHDGLPTHLATELCGLLAPAKWPEGGLRIDELWPVPEHLDEDQINSRRSRVDAWLEDLDEFGTMIYAVTSDRDGCKFYNRDSPAIRIDPTTP